MRTEWQIEDKHIKAVIDVIAENKDKKFVKNRINKNIRRRGEKRRTTSVSLEQFWKSLTCAVLTSLQKSGEGSRFVMLRRTDPFPLSYEQMDKWKANEDEIRQTIYGFVHYIKKTRYIGKNFEIIRKSWHDIERELESLSIPPDPEKWDTKRRDTERELAVIIAKNFMGVGPKQARNALQDLGLTIYEIPIDSKVTNWLNEIEFPITVSPRALQNKKNYHFVLDKIQLMCEEAREQARMEPGGLDPAIVFPCVLDAAIFSR